MIKAASAILLAIFMQNPVFAEIPGTARSNERDKLRLDSSVGLTSPAPGIGFGASALRTFRPEHAYGLAVNVLHHGPGDEYERINTQAYDFVWEYSVALLEGFHALRLRGGLGASNAYLQKNPKALGYKADNPRRHVWCGHALVQVALDVPVADLVWVRFGLASQQAFTREAPLQSAFFVGAVFGGQWIGIGD